MLPNTSCGTIKKVLSHKSLKKYSNILIGNYLPKTKQSYTMGIKLPWTLHSEENWNRTHRMAGFLWVIGGTLMVLISLLHLWQVWMMLVIITVMVLVPTVYSYLLYKKGI